MLCFLGTALMLFVLGINFSGWVHINSGDKTFLEVRNALHQYLAMVVKCDLLCTVFPFLDQLFFFLYIPLSFLLFLLCFLTGCLRLVEQIAPASDHVCA